MSSSESDMNEFTFDADDQVWVGYRPFSFLHWEDEEEGDEEEDSHSHDQDVQDVDVGHDHSHDHAHDHSHDVAHDHDHSHDHAHDHDCGHDHDHDLSGDVTEEELQAFGVYRIDIQATEEGPHVDQQLALKNFLAAEEPTCDAVLEVVRRYYTEKVRPGIPDAVAIDDINELGDIVQFQGLVVRDRSSDGEAALGFVFAVAWDDERHLGVVMHQGKPLDIGTWEMAFIGPREEPEPWLVSTYGTQTAERAGRLIELD